MGDTEANVEGAVLGIKADVGESVSEPGDMEGAVVPFRGAVGEAVPFRESVGAAVAFLILVGAAVLFRPMVGAAVPFLRKVGAAVVELDKGDGVGDSGAVVGEFACARQTSLPLNISHVVVQGPPSKQFDPGFSTISRFPGPGHARGLFKVL